MSGFFICVCFSRSYLTGSFPSDFIDIPVSFSQGHSKGEVWGLDTHPRILEAVSVGGDNTLRRWDIGIMQALGTANLRKAARCLNFHPIAPMLAIGFLDGKWR